MNLLIIDILVVDKMILWGISQDPIGKYILQHDFIL